MQALKLFASGILIMATLLTLPVVAQERDNSRRMPSRDDRAALEKRYQRKLRSSFLEKSPWIWSMSDAQRISRGEDKPIFGYFTRSYSP